MKFGLLSALLAVIILFPATSSVAADATPTAEAKSARPSGPQIQFDSPIFDFGKTNSGSSVKHDFIFTNTGTATLQVTAVRPGCGCTTAGDWDKTVEPGKTGVIPLQYNSSGSGGTVAKSVSVFCNDPAHSNVVLQITGTLWRPIEVIPQMAAFNVVSDTETNEVKTLHITSFIDEPVTLSDLQVSGTNTFRAELKTIRPGKEFELQVTALAPYTATNPIASPITIKTSSTKMPVINVTAYLTVRPPVSVLPVQLSMPPGKLTSSMGLSAMVRNEGATPLTLSDIKIDYPGAEVRMTETVPGKIFNLAISLPAGFQLKEDEKSLVTMKSNHPKYPVITLPVIQRYPSYFPKPPPTPPTPSTAAKLTPGSK